MRADIYPLQMLLLTVSGWVHKHQGDVIAYLVEENRVLKEQMKGRALRLNDDQRRRLAAKAKVLGRKALDQVATIVTPDTLMRWHHRLIALKWTFEAKKRVGRPGLMKAIAALIVRMARENSLWGYSRIQGELKDLGHCVARTTVANVMKANGIKPAPDRPSSWKTFLKAHWGEIAATDFFATEVWTPLGLKTYYVLFVKTRRVEIAGITRHPTGAFVAQVARNLTDVADGFLKDHRFLICDRDTKFTDQFRRILCDFGVEIVLTPRRAPNCNAYAERFVLTIKSECLRRMIFLGEASLRRAISEFVVHYHQDRAHQGLGNEHIEQRDAVGDGEVVCDERLGGLLKCYRRAAGRTGSGEAMDGGRADAETPRSVVAQVA
ncbi:MAG: integrase core domain-containing protein [Dehalococcoidia bacterium]